jgi:hypothetical protein
LTSKLKNALSSNKGDLLLKSLLQIFDSPIETCSEIAKIFEDHLPQLVELIQTVLQSPQLTSDYAEVINRVVYHSSWETVC